MLKRLSEQIPLSFLLVFTEWYEHHAEINHLVSQVTLWSPKFVPISEASFAPICRIAGKFLQIKTQMNSPDRQYNNGELQLL